MKTGTNKFFIIGIIVLVIILIFFGVMIFVTKMGEKLSDEETSAFNGPFLEYEGSKAGADVNKLLDKIVESNQLEENAKRQIKLNADSLKDTKSKKVLLGEENGRYTVLRNRNIIGENSMYEVSFEYAFNGLINTVKIDN